MTYGIIFAILQLDITGVTISIIGVVILPRTLQVKHRQQPKSTQNPKP